MISQNVLGVSFNANLSPFCRFREIDFCTLLQGLEICVYWLLMKTNSANALPTDTVLAEIEALRELLHSTLAHNAKRINTRLDEVQGKVESLAKKKKTSSVHLRDLRDMLTLLRKHNVKPEKARRRDIKKIDEISDDLAMLTETW